MKKQLIKHTMVVAILFIASCKTEQNVQAQTAGRAANTFNISAGTAPDDGDLKLSQIRLPQGFTIDVFARDIKNARSMCLSPGGILFVGTRGEGKVYALVDEDGDNKADKTYLLASELRQPNGVAFKDGDLYVAEVSRVLRFTNIEQNLSNPTFEVLYDGYPSDGHHGWKYIAFGPDGKLYVPVGAPCNICEPDDPYASITRLDIQTKQMEVVQRGIRNTVGLTWHPQTNELWFTDNGRDWLGDDLPACELNHATEDDMHFGFPYCHQGDLPDEEFGDKRNCNEFEPPVQKLGPHVAPLGLEFYTGTQFPNQFKDQVFLAEHGSWNRSTPIGYRITLVTLNADGKSTGYHIFADGWLQNNGSPWGRPVDVEFMPDGSLLVSDDYANAIYRISYEE
jgi:glucose/arabinose dehydrogenase